MAQANLALALRTAAPAPAAEAGQCHICGAARALAPISLSGWQLVSSDCRGWTAPLLLGQCPACRTVQKVINRRWRQESARVYRGYSPYHQAGGAEQKVASPTTGVLKSRSEVLLERLMLALPFGDGGKMLDIGCGTGVMLRAFHAARPGWSLAGYDRLGVFRGAIESIAPGCSFHRGTFTAITGRYDFISLVHSLEHMVDPVAFLAEVAPKLSDTGVLLVQVPDAEANPFDLMVVDHCTHFTEHTLAATAIAAGFKNVRVVRTWASKELSLVAGPGVSTDAIALERRPHGESGLCANSLAWLGGLAGLTMTVRRERPRMGIFGTSIGGIWLFEATDRTADFFVDEDLGRVGRSLLGVPIYHPADVPAGSTVISALPPPIGERIAARLARPGVEYVCWPQPGWAGPSQGPQQLTSASA